MSYGASSPRASAWTPRRTPTLIPITQMRADLIINADDDRTTNAYAPRVRKGVCVDLDDARGLYERLPELLEKVRRTVVDKIPHVLRGRGVEDNLAVRLHFKSYIYLRRYFRTGDWTDGVFLLP